MSFSPAALGTPPIVLTPASLEALGAPFANRGSNPTSGAWPASNRALYVPFTLRTAATVYKVFWANGATASGNVDMGIFASTSGKPGALVISTGSTAQSGTDTLQTIDIADTQLVGGVLYYMALVNSGSTGTFYRYTTPVANLLTMLGCCQSATSLPLAANPTIATLASSYTPMFGLVFDTSAVL